VVPRFADVVDQKEKHPGSEQEEHVLGERVRRGRAAEGVDRGRGDQEHQGRADGIPRVETRPDRVSHVRREERQERFDERERHTGPRFQSGLRL